MLARSASVAGAPQTPPAAPTLSPAHSPANATAALRARRDPGGVDDRWSLGRRSVHVAAWALPWVGRITRHPTRPKPTGDARRVPGNMQSRTGAPAGQLIRRLWVPRTPSTSRHQAISMNESRRADQFESWLAGWLVGWLVGWLGYRHNPSTTGNGPSAGAISQAIDADFPRCCELNYVQRSPGQ